MLHDGEFQGQFTTEFLKVIEGGWEVPDPNNTEYVIQYPLSLQPITGTDYARLMRRLGEAGGMYVYSYPCFSDPRFTWYYSEPYVFNVDVFRRVPPATIGYMKCRWLSDRGIRLD